MASEEAEAQPEAEEQPQEGGEEQRPVPDGPVLRPEEENPEDELAEDDADEAPAFLEEGGADDGTVVEEEEINSDFEGVDVEESLKDSVEGSLRLKRLLSRDDDLDGGEKKRRRGFEESEKPEFKLKVNMLLGRWGLLQDKVCKHVLDSLTLDELTELAATNYSPDKYNNWKSPPELLAKHTNELRERKMINNHSVDMINAFKFRWKISSEAEKILRTMDHKSLRYVLENHDGVKPIEDTMKEGVLFDAEEAITEHAIPNNPGPTTMSRFHRLELIDPLAAAAVFGDANLTFALRLASHRKALGHVGRVIATTFEELETLRERYHEIDESVKTLEDMFCEVYHGVDCTRIAIDSRFKELEGTLGAAYYNFPHSGAIQGFFDGHPCVNWRHENLMRLFFRALRSYIKPGGIVKVASNASAVGVRYSYIVGGAIENEFIHTETVPFLEWHLHRYGRSYGDKRDVYKRPDAQNNQSYNAQRAEADMVYCFAYAPTGKPMPPQAVRLPPSLKTLTACVDGPFTKTQGQGRINLARQLHKRFVTEVSGTHVG